MNWPIRSWKAMSWPTGAIVPPEWQAHRGFWSAGFRENGIEAFRAARVAGFKMCELDLRISGDGEPVVFHDGDLRRLLGKRDRLDRMTAADLKRTAGIPHLRDVLLDASVTDLFNLELKSWPQDFGRLERAVVRVVEETRSEHRVIFSSFNPLGLAFLSTLAPDIPRAMLLGCPKSTTDVLELIRWASIPVLSFHMLNIEGAALSKPFCAQLRDQGIPFAVWTVNSADDAQKFRDWGAISIITDHLKPALPAPEATL